MSVPVELIAMCSLRAWFVSPSDLTVAAAFPLTIAAILIVASLSVSVRDLRRTGPEFDLHDRGPAVALVLGSVGIVLSLAMALDHPDSVPAFVVGAVGATGCYLGVFRRIFVDGGGTLLEQLVAVSSLLWTAGALTVGAIAGVGAGHYAAATGYGTVLVIAIVVFTIGQRRGTQSSVVTSELLGGLLFAGALLLPAMVGTFFGEEILFVTYSIAFVLTAILWWFLRLSVGSLAVGG